MIGPQVHIHDPPLARFLFSSTRAAWLWLPVRLYVGLDWVTVGLRGLRDPAWMADGSALLRVWEEAAFGIGRSGPPRAGYEWVRALTTLLIDAEVHPVAAKLVVFGELAVGAALILGAFVGIAAFAGAFVNLLFLLAGTTGGNPLLLFLAVGLMLAWKTAGYVGLDRLLLPTLGTPWPSRPPD
jgi:thiosulfate dehydrogenase [quinone] large subunit